MRRWVRLLASSPVLIVADIGFTAGVTVIVLGLVGASPSGSPILVGLVLMSSSAWLALGRLNSLKPRTPEPPSGGGQLPPAQEGVMDLKGVEREKVAAVAAGTPWPSPNMRVQRTHSSPSAHRWPLTRYRFGGQGAIGFRVRSAVRLLVAVPWIAAVCASGCDAKRSANRQLAADQAIINRLEQEWSNAAPTRDVKVYEKVLADDFVGQWADGSQSGKRDTIEALASGRDAYEEATLGPLDIRVYGDTAVVTGSFTEKSTLSGRNGSGKYSFLDVWVRRNGRWQVVAFKSLRLSAQEP